MHIPDVMDDLGLALKAVQGVRSYPYNIESVSPPAAVVVWPERIVYDETMARGMDRITIPIIVVVGQISQRSSRDQLAKFMAGSGPSSIKAAVERYPATSYHSARVTTVIPDSYDSGGVELLGASFEVDIIGEGA